jgi:hypothetical protein
MDQCKQEMKDRLKEAYKANYRSIIDQKSQNYLSKLEKLEAYANGCIEDFEKKMAKGKYVIVCNQKPKIEELYSNLNKFDQAF